MGTAATRAKNKYAKKNYDRIILLVPIGQKQKLAKYAQEIGGVLHCFNHFIISHFMTTYFYCIICIYYNLVSNLFSYFFHDFILLVQKIVLYSLNCF